MLYLFQLGHQPHISVAEIEAVFSRLSIGCKTIKQAGQNLLIEIQTKLDCGKLIQLLGGTVKISEKIIEDKNAISSLVQHLNKLYSTGKIHFSLSGKNAKSAALEIKKGLKKIGRSVRYIEPKNTATILHNKLVEKEADLAVVGSSIFVTRAIQPFEEFSERDYGRPKSDSASGMLPPKLARIMINLSGSKQGEIILDPFCGSGTILMEAAFMGYTNFVGSDIAGKAIQDTGHNLEWIKNNFSLPSLPYRLLNAGAAELGERLDEKSIDFIVTEPYLGGALKGNESRDKLSAQAKELKELYLGVFMVFHKILKAGGSAVFIIPRFRHQSGWITIDCADEIKKTGFEIIPLSKKERFLLYWRTKQRLGREIWKFKKIQ
ncbi:MAG: DNA methyltransferase [Patescibacteria group bacterium]